MLIRLLVAVALVASVGGAAHAFGDKRAAAAHFQKGRALFDANNFAAALEEFQAGYDAYPLPGFLVNIGQCERKLDRLDDASAAFQHYLDSDNTDLKVRVEVQDALAEITAERDRRLAAEVEARRQRDEAERRHPLEEPSPRTVVRTEPVARPLPVAAMPAAATSSAPVAAVEQHPQKSRKWVWAVVSVIAVGAAASAIAVGVVETQPPAAHAGSLGLLDGRR